LPMKAKSSRFDSLVARYYPAVYSLASRSSDRLGFSDLVRQRRSSACAQEKHSARRDKVTPAAVIL
jgi:hypothetical protein